MFAGELNNGGTLGENIGSRLLGGGRKEDYFYKVLKDVETSDKEFTEMVETLYWMTMKVTIHLHTRVSRAITFI